jgi:hypothetical protein
MEPIVEPNPSFIVLITCSGGRVVRARNRDTRNRATKALSLIAEVRSIMAMMLNATRRETISVLIFIQINQVLTIKMDTTDRLHSPVGEKVAGRKDSEFTPFLTGVFYKKEFLLVVPVEKLGERQHTSVTVSSNYAEETLPYIMSVDGAVFPEHIFQHHSRKRFCTMNTTSSSVKDGIVGHTLLTCLRYGKSADRFSGPE